MLLRRIIPVLLILSMAGCAGLGGEPRIVATIPPATPAFPSRAPDVALGAAIYAENCTQCHGVGGAGDGELIGTGEGQIQQSPRSFIDRETTAAQTPLDWYTTITNGRIENLMPPWRDALSDEERWDVALYTYTLHYEADAIGRGSALIVATNAVPPEISQEEIVRLTDVELVTRFLTATGGVDTWSEAQREDVAAYLRSLSLANMGVIEPVEPSVTPEATAEITVEPVQTVEAGVVTGTVAGQLSNGTAGGIVPDGLAVTLNVLDADFNNTPRETTTGADGQYQFENVPFQADFSYIVTVHYEGRTFGSDLAEGSSAGERLNLPITIYDITNDTANIRIAGMVSQISVVDTTLQIAQVVSFQNISDKAFSTNEAIDEQRYASVRVTVPQGAEVVSVSENDSRYVISSDGTAVIDTAPVLPNTEHLMQVVYRLPYTGQSQIAHPIDYTVSGPVRLLVTPEAIQVISDQFETLGPQNLGGVVYQSYGIVAVLAVGDTVRYTLQGGEVSNAPTGVVTSNQLVPVILIGLGLVAVLAAGVSYWRGRQSAAPAASDHQLLIDGLIREIAELDAAYGAGEIKEAAYQKRRGRLKGRLAELIDN